MIVVLKSLIYERIKTSLAKLDIIELDEDGRIEYRGHSAKAKSRHWREEGEVDLTALTKSETEKLLKVLEDCGVHGAKMIAADIKKYLKASKEGVDAVRARTCRQAAWMLEHYFKNLPNHIIFSEDEYGGRSHTGYYVGDVDYIPPSDPRRGERQTPEHAEFDLWWVEDDSRHRRVITMYREDCCEMTCVEMLKEAGYVPETKKLMETLRAETERFYEQRAKIGLQCVATGYGVADLDDATRESERSHWYGRDKIKLDHFDQPSRVVIDVLQEKDDEDKSHRNSRDDSPDPYRWHNWNARFHTPSEEEVVRHLEADDDTAEAVDFEIPVHPLVPCFDLKRHLRLRVHVNNLVDYEYHTEVSTRLVLPDRDWKMINLLVDHSSNTFQDIVSGKGQSMNVLAVGPPGTGKTATAEIFSEFKKRPLYTIQCSQLGMNPEEVETHLGIIMQRANRWNAVLLLDEADVYIRKRGTDLNQNAIVGAFLRVLEYASCILFMTTNIEDSIDDAITSRCIAKLSYGVPSPESQGKIWKILADLNGIELPPREIDKITTAHPKLTGRDVKNLLKLASFAKNGKPIGADTIDYVLQFKPTENN